MPKQSIDLSIIVASKETDITSLKRLISSIDFACETFAYEIILVSSDPNIETNLSDIQSKNMSWYFVPPEGVYAALNEGITHTQGRLIYFIGMDDIMLPGMRNALSAALNKDCINTIHIGNVCDELGHIWKPSCLRIGILFQNWHHQGILYPRQVFDTANYDCRFRIQADHALNIKFAADSSIKVKRLPYLVAFFSHGGLSTTKSDSLFRAEMPSIVRQEFGIWHSLICILRRSLGTLKRGFSK